MSPPRRFQISPPAAPSDPPPAIPSPFPFRPIHRSSPSPAPTEILQGPTASDPAVPPPTDRSLPRLASDPLACSGSSIAAYEPLQAFSLRPAASAAPEACSRQASATRPGDAPPSSLVDPPAPLVCLPARPASKPLTSAESLVDVANIRPPVAPEASLADPLARGSPRLSIAPPGDTQPGDLVGQSASLAHLPARPAYDPFTSGESLVDVANIHPPVAPEASLADPLVRGSPRPSTAPPGEARPGDPVGQPAPLACLPARPASDPLTSDESLSDAANIGPPAAPEVFLAGPLARGSSRPPTATPGDALSASLVGQLPPHRLPFQTTAFVAIAADVAAHFSSSAQSPLLTPGVTAVSANAASHDRPTPTDRLTTHRSK